MQDIQETLVELDDVRLTLEGGGGPVEVLKGVDLVAQAGESLSIVGPSGAGKTTLLMVMAGMERPSSGRVLVAGQDLTTLDEDGLALFRRGRISVIFQGFHLVPTMTALENVGLPLELAGDNAAHEAAREALAAVGLDSRQDHYPSQLSGGEQQRVAIARGFVGHPALLLADEPTGNLDESTSKRVMDLIFTMQTEIGAGLILITHDPSLAARCGRGLEMHDGRLTHSRGEAARQ